MRFVSATTGGNVVLHRPSCSSGGTVIDGAFFKECRLTFANDASGPEILRLEAGMEEEWRFAGEFVVFADCATEGD